MSSFRYAISASATFLMLAVPAQAEKIDFNRDVRPILSDKCFFCHGPDEHERKGGLRLDIREAALADNDGVRAIVPGDLEKSEFIYRIITDDKDELMPPEESHKHLSKKEIEIFKKWIKEGAEYEGQWIYEKPLKAKPPKTFFTRKKSPVDLFVRAELKKKKLKPAKEADKVTLLRRLSFDLTGLPPTVEEVEAFVSDRSKDAYKKQVDRLLASPAYGERMAAKWLDMVRYADTVGFHGDQNVSQSPYRDYVIHAFNSNMSYAQFTREQLAGDLLPNPTLQQKVASGYNRLNMTTEEGGAQPKEYLAKYATDRVANISSVWMGATVQCAECHDHKFDPYTAKDFYSMAAFFADLKEVGKYGARKRPPEIPVPSKADEDRRKKLIAERDALKASLQVDTPELTRARDAWQQAILADSTAGVANDSYFIEDKLAPKVKGEGTWKYVTAKDGQVFRGAHARVQEGKGIVQHFFRNRADYAVSNEDVFFLNVYLDPKNPPKTIMLQVHDKKSSWSHRGYWGADKITYGAGNGPDHKRMGDLPAAGGWVRLEVPAKMINLKKGNVVTGFAFTQFDGKAWWDDAGVSTSSSRSKELLAALKNPARTAAQQTLVDTTFLAETPLVAKKRAALSAKEKAIAQASDKAPTMPISVAVKPRMMRILPRGNWMDESGEVVQPAIPEFLGKLDTGDKRATRLDLANWLVSEDNPMTARTFVNHLWHMYFGAGISNVLSDLGNQGEPPTHPELLDWLSVEFMESGWDVKHVIGLIVNSETYKQSSFPKTDLSEKDPYNRLLSRQSPRRFTAEMVRDNALKVSGLLVDQIGGKSVHPYQPKGHYAQLNFPRRTYKHSTDENQWRRAVYSHWQRTFLHPAMQAFDAPPREACTAQRSVSNTPLQALTLMNDPSFVEAARVYAEQAITQADAAPEAKADYLWEQTLLRQPSEKERSILLGIYDKHKSQYAQSPEAAKELLSVGLKKPGDVDPIELAAWTSVARVVLNLHETITRN